MSNARCAITIGHSYCVALNRGWRTSWRGGREKLGGDGVDPSYFHGQT